MEVERARVRGARRPGGNGIAVRFDRTRGKGSHGTLYYGERHTVVKDRGKPLKTGTLHGMCKQLGIDPDDL
ncbi:MAG: type II toxin-antitoxin system HicA family toxin [Bryobacterales bacterium]|nr:type II toxin-antitoxin system HicA family toxin [Bryobacterales bacterium]